MKVFATTILSLSILFTTSSAQAEQLYPALKATKITENAVIFEACYLETAGSCYLVGDENGYYTDSLGISKAEKRFRFGGSLAGAIVLASASYLLAWRVGVNLPEKWTWFTVAAGVGSAGAITVNQYKRLKLEEDLAQARELSAPGTSFLFPVKNTRQLEREAKRLEKILKKL